MVIWRTSRLRELFRPAAEIHQEADESRQFDVVYFAMLVLSSLIALLGLLLNSPAVIIGAMLIAPLMGPILACGLALTAADWNIGKKAARNVALSVVEAIVITALATRLSPLREVTPEIMARVNPNLMDLLIALFSGIAGTLALGSRKTAMTILPGVAIATALIPPLATVGYSIGTAQWPIASGAIMLFFTNCAAIVLSAGLVFLVIGVRPQNAVADRQHFIARYRIAIAVLLVMGLSVPLMRTLLSAAQQVQFQTEVSNLLKKRLHKSDGRQLVSVKLQIAKDRVGVAAIVQTSRFIEPPEVRALQGELTGLIGRPVRLELQQLQLARKESASSVEVKDFLGGGVVQQTESKEMSPSTTATIAKAQETTQASLTSLLSPVGVSELTVHSLSLQPDGELQIVVSASQNRAVGQSPWQVAAESVSRDLGVPLFIRADVTSTDHYELKYEPNSIRVTKRQIAELQAFIHTSLGPGITYVLIYSSTTGTELTTRRIALVGRYFHGTDLSSEPESKLSPDLIMVRDKARFEVRGGRTIAGTKQSLGPSSE
jgi:uncharacterized hydrophobic protein (TIGR00271 family)